MYAASAFIGRESAVGISVNKSDPSVVRERKGLPSNHRAFTCSISCTEFITVGLWLSVAERVISIHCRTLSLSFLSSCVLGEVDERPVYTESSPPSTPRSCADL